jgi:hypothetical protein
MKDGDVSDVTLPFRTGFKGPSAGVTCIHSPTIKKALPRGVGRAFWKLPQIGGGKGARPVKHGSNAFATSSCPHAGEGGAKCGVFGYIRNIAEIAGFKIAAKDIKVATPANR